ncbi:MAG: hypothetical protein FWG45_00960 [Oscillospiraceae bacterium]|nr:hypothetical protein [Oscillospiraceae bacterium]
MEEIRKLRGYKPTIFKAPSSVYKEGFADMSVLFCNQLKHTKGRWYGVLDGKVVDPTFYPVIYSANDDDDWQSEEVWKRVNPSYGITIDKDGFRTEFEDAKLNPANENTFRRLNLNQWVKQLTRHVDILTELLKLHRYKC